MTATPHVGMHRYTYLTGNLAAVIVDMAHSLDNEYIYEAELEKTADNEITGMRRTRDGQIINIFISLARFSKSFQTVEVCEK